MDANGDGVIHESEVPEERRRMFQFMAERAGVDPSQGVAIAKVIEGMANRGGGPRPGEAASGQPAAPAAAPASPEAAPTEAAAAKPAEPQLPPLVSGFGVDTRREPAPGFGTRVQPQPRMGFGSVAQAENNAGAPAVSRRADGSSGASREDAQNDDSRSRDSSTAQLRSSYRFLSPHERLPEGLPDWFVDRDTNLDGQVTMAEFADEWTDSKVEEFFKYDGNNDGVITVEEALNPVDHAVESAGDSRHVPAVDRTEARSGSGGSGASAPAQPAPATTGDAPKPWWLEP